MQPPDYLADYLALRAANDNLRERGKAWLFETMERLCAERNRQFSPAAPPSANEAPNDSSPNEAPNVPPVNLPPPNTQQVIQFGRQPWQFKVNTSTMVGERMGLRYRMNTLVIEIGWPREPDHGHVPDQGLARGRVGLSQNPMIEPQYIRELILKGANETSVAWHFITQQQVGELITEKALENFLQLLLSEGPPA